MGNHRLANRIDIETIRPNQVFHLPHIEQVFRYILFSFLPRDNHDCKDKLYSDKAW